MAPTLAAVLFVVPTLGIHLRQGQKKDRGPGDYGKSGCQCLGLDKVNGSTTVDLGDDGVVEYPRDMGSHCDTWDLTVYPSCLGSDKPSWCSDSWCYVDPCTCDYDGEDIPAPKASSYIPNGRVRGRQIYYSYATCGSGDSWTDKETAAADAAAISGECSKAVDDAVVGNSSCRCVGVANRSGTLSVNIGGTSYSYPADTGSYCTAWDKDNSPSCTVADPPTWCSDNWCYVDPCSCDLSVLPKATDYVPGAVVAGNPVYYSYLTCGVGADSYTDADEAAADQAAIAGICS